MWHPWAQKYSQKHGSIYISSHLYFCLLLISVGMNFTTWSSICWENFRWYRNLGDTVIRGIWASNQRMCVRGIERSHQRRLYYLRGSSWWSLSLTIQASRKLILAFTVGAFDADWSKVGRKPAHSMNLVPQGDTSGCSPGISQATSSPPRSGVVCGRSRGVHPFYSQSILLCSSKQPEFSSCGSHPPKCSSLVGRLKGTVHFLLVRSPCRSCLLNSIARHCILRCTTNIN